MESNKSKDYLKILYNNEINSKLNNEIILFSDKVVKSNRFGVRQQRYLIITDLALYNFKRQSKFKIFFIIN